MKRRNAIKVGIGTLASTGIGLFAISNAFKVKNIPIEKPNNLEYKYADNERSYVSLNPETTARLAYKLYSDGGCMYAIFGSVVSQLAEKIGEPYASIPFKMYQYGHGGVGGYGTLCGAVNGAAALIGLLVSDKDVRDTMITDIFQWYERTPLPAFKPTHPKFDFTLPSVVSNSVLCHASNTNWSDNSGYNINSDERKERCRCLTADVAKKLTTMLNEIFSETYITNTYNNVEKQTCLSCHGNQGKIKNSAVKMNCNSCHSESLGHRFFSDIHYKLMEE
jgi:hypothetical protein